LWLFLASLQFSLSDLRILTPWLFLAFFTIFAVRWAIFSLSYNFHLMWPYNFHHRWPAHMPLCTHFHLFKPYIVDC
jgi:hypothetical protein